MTGADAGSAPGAARGVVWRELLAVGAALLLLGAVFTWPLARHMTTDVLYTNQAHPGYERVPIAQGDHLQLLYFFWLFGDSVREGRVPLTDHYEFRDGSPPAFFFQPSLLPLLTFLLSPLGLIASYNLLTLFSFVGAGLATHLLLRLEIDDRWAAGAGALVVALLPYRVGQLAGHANGFLAFLIPLYLFFLERSLRAGRWVGWALAAGVTFFFSGAMEFHIVYYLSLLLALYLPFRFFTPLSAWLHTHDARPAAAPGPVPSLFATLGGAGAGIAMYHAVDSVHRFGRPAGWAATAAIGGALGFLSWRLLSRTASRHLPPVDGGWQRACSLPFAPLVLLALVPLGIRLGIPHFGKFTAAAAVAGAAVLALPLLRRIPGARLVPGAGDLLRDRAHRYLAHVALIGLTLGYLLVVRKLIFAPSVAGRGRLFSDVMAYSPHPIDLISWHHGDSERLAYVGVVAAALALIGLVAARWEPEPGRRARLGFYAGTAVTGLLLAVGPNLALFPLYHLLFRFVPMFNLPRVSGRIFLIAVVGLAALAALGLAALRRRAGRLAGVLTAAVLALLLADYLPRHAPGLTTLPLKHPVYDRLERERAADETILELPIWPGDTAWTSIYLWFTTRYRTLMVNGYSPATPRAYVERIFKPLYPLDFGEMRRPQYDLLRSLGIRFIVFHEEAYPRKISDFPFRVVTENLKASKYLETVEYAAPLWLFRLRPDPPSEENPVAGAASPVGSLWEAEQWSGGRGARKEDHAASGGALVAFPAAAGALNRPFPGRVYPTGSYSVQTRLLAERPGAAPGMTLEVRQEPSGEHLAAADVLPGSDKDGILDMETGFTLSAPGKVFVTLASDGSAPVLWDYALVRFDGVPDPPSAIEIEDLWHMGIPVADRGASGGMAVEVLPGYHPRDYAFSGPDRVLPAGAWVARLRVGGVTPAAPAGGELFEVSLSNTERPLASVPLTEGTGSGDYQEVALPFDLARPAPVSFRVLFTGRRRLVLDRIVIAPR